MPGHENAANGAPTEQTTSMAPPPPAAPEQVAPVQVAPAPSAPSAPAAPNPGAASPSLADTPWSLFFSVPLAIWRGDNIGAYKQTKQFGNHASQWLIFVGVTAGLFALASTINLAVQVDSFLGALGPLAWFIDSPSFGSYFVAFIIAAILVAGWYMLRILTTQWLLMLRVRPATFFDAARVVAGASYVHTLSLVVFFVLALIPGTFGNVLKFLILLPLMFFVLVVSEMTLFTFVNQVARPKKSIVVPYVFMLMATAGMFGVGFLILSVIAGASAL